jgi:hypothetical protein
MAVFSIAFCVLALSANECYAGEQAWFLKQNEKGLGEERLYIGKTGARGEEPQFGTVSVSTNKDPNYYFFNSSKRIYYVGEKRKSVSNENVRIAILMGLSSHTSDNMNWTQMKFHKEGSGSILKLPASKFVTTDAKNKTWEIWVTGTLGMTAEQCQRSCAFRGLPFLGGLPLRVLYRTKSGAPNMILDTAEAHKTTMVPADYECPKGYKRVSNLYDVISAKSDFLNDALDVLDTRK